MRRWMWIVLAVAVVGGGVYAWASTVGSSGRAQQAVVQQRTYMPVGRSTITRTLSYSGSLEPAEDVTLVAGSAGTVKEVLVSKGDRVKAGDVIARMDDTDAQLDVIRARREYDQARLESPPGVIEEKRLSLMLAERKLEATKIVAPFDGIVVDVFVRAGDSVGSQGQIARLVDTSRYKVTLAIDQNDLAYVAVGQSVYVRPDAVRGLVLVGRIEEIGFLPSSMDSTTTYPVVISLDPVGFDAAAAGGTGFGAGGRGGFRAAGGFALGPGAGPGPGAQGAAAVGGGPGAGARGGGRDVPGAGPAQGAAPGEGSPEAGGQAPSGVSEVNKLVADLRPGMSVEAEIVIASAENVLVVPIASIVESGRQQLVTRVNADGVEEVVEIETGLSDGLFVEVRSGLSEGDLIVSNNYALYQQIGAQGTQGGPRPGQGPGGFTPGGFGPATRVITGR